MHEQEDYTFTSLTGQAIMSLSKGQQTGLRQNRRHSLPDRMLVAGSGGWYYRTLLNAQDTHHSTLTGNSTDFHTITNLSPVLLFIHLPIYPSQLGAVLYCKRKSWVCSLCFPISFTGRLGKKTFSLFWAHWNIVMTVCSIILSIQLSTKLIDFPCPALPAALQTVCWVKSHW